MTAALRQSPFLAYPMDQHAMPTRPPSKPRAIPSTDDEQVGALRREGLLAANLGYLMALEAAGCGVLASQLVDKIAAGLERQPAIRVVGAGAAELPDAERGRSDDDLRRLDILNRRIAKPLPKGDKKAEREREENLREREALEARPHLAADGRWAKAANEESVTLALGRGEEVSQDKGGVRRILDRDPVLGLVKAGHLTLEQGDVGQALRECYDRRAEDAGAAEFTGMPGGGHDHEKFIASRFLRAKATYVIGQIEIAVLCGHYRTRDATLRQVVMWARFKAEKVETHIALTMLRAICRDGKSLSSQGEGRALERNAKALALALDVADAVIEGAG